MTGYPVEGPALRLTLPVATATVVAPGGLAVLFDEHTDLFDQVDSDLTLNGLGILAGRSA